MIAIRIVGAAVLVVAVAFIPAHVLLHGDEVSVSLLIWSGCMAIVGGTLLSERAMRSAAGFVGGLLPAKWRGQ